MGDYHVRICERLRGKCPRSTRLLAKRDYGLINDKESPDSRKKTVNRESGDSNLLVNP